MHVCYTPRLSSDQAGGRAGDYIALKLGLSCSSSVWTDVLSSNTCLKEEETEEEAQR